MRWRQQRRPPARLTVPGAPPSPFFRRRGNMARFGRDSIGASFAMLEIRLVLTPLGGLPMRVQAQAQDRRFANGVSAVAGTVREMVRLP